MLAEMSKRWSSLTQEEKTSWNHKANSLEHFSDQKKKKVIRELIAVTEQNVSPSSSAPPSPSHTHTHTFILSSLRHYHSLG